MIELHCHTTASDGTLSPDELVALADDLGITQLAITDHDSTAGVVAAHSACQAAAIRLIPAIELSTRYLEQPVDVLGYGIDPESPTLCTTLEQAVTARNERIPRMIKRLQEAGLEITVDDVRRRAPGGVVGRPHVAHALVEMGAVADVQEAFMKYLARGQVGYVPKEVLTPEQAVGVIREAGGIAVLAHPCYLKLESHEFEALLDQLMDAGLVGLEVHYSQHTRADVHSFARWARKKELLPTGGSDFHGTNKPHISLGMGPEGEKLPEHLADDLLDAIAKHAR